VKHSNGNIDWKATLEKYILPAIQSQNAPRSVRGNLYHMLSKNVLMKDDYEGLDDVLTRARKDGTIPWDAVLDGSGRGVINDFDDYEESDDFVDRIARYVNDAGEIYRKRIPRWYGQKHYVEYWVETGTMAQTIKGYLGHRQIRVAHNKGNPGWKFAYDNSERLYKELDEHEHLEYDLDALYNKQIHIYYFGDDDKYGNDMDLFIREQLQHFDLLPRHVEFRRLALIPEQERRYDLPANFETEKGYQLDALEAYAPDAFRLIVQDPVDNLFDEDIHKKMLNEKKHSGDDILRKIRKKLGLKDTKK
jgi:hypothetical protein